MYLNGVLCLYMFDVISVHFIDVQDTILEKKKRGPAKLIISAQLSQMGL